MAPGAAAGTRLLPAAGFQRSTGTSPPKQGPSSVSLSGEHRTKGKLAIPGGVSGSRRFRGQLFLWGMGEHASAGTDFVDGGSNQGEDGLGRGHLAAKSSGPEMGTPGESGGLPGGF